MLRSLRIENLVLIREAELTFAPGLNAVTGETGAGKTIFAQAIGLLLGARADASSVGADGSEAYVEAELDVPDGFFDDEELGSLAELRPEGEAGLVVARRVFGDGRTRAYAWGRAVAREDVASATERLIAMSGQFEQRRLGRPSFQLDVLDAFCGPAQEERRGAAALTWRELVAARRRHDELTRDADAVAARLAERQALVDATEGMQPNEEAELLARRERLRHVEELAEAASAAASAIAPDEGEGAASLAAGAERALAPLERIAPELAAAAEELRDLAVRLVEVGSDLHRFVASLDAEPGAIDHVEERLQAIADFKRRFAAESYESLLEAAAAAASELGATDGVDPVEAAASALSVCDATMSTLANELHAERAASATAFGEAVRAELGSLGMGEGELSRIALALAAVAGGETLVFDEIDAGIGGVTAHAVAATLQRLAERAQVLTITHLPQIASVAERHFRVEKLRGDPTHTRIEELDDLLRREELERMAGGAEFVASLTDSSL